MSYEPGYVDDPKVANELTKLADLHNGPLQLTVWYAAPIRPRDGWVVYADGTSWNPGSGEGIYHYTNGAWVRMTSGGNILTNTASLNFGSIASNGTAELTITVTGAATGDAVYLGAPSTIESGIVFAGYVSASNTVTVRLHNTTGGAVDPAAATWRAVVIKF